MGHSRKRQQCILFLVVTSACAGARNEGEQQASEPTWAHEVLERIEVGRYRFEPDDGGFQVQSAAKGLLGRFDADGAHISTAQDLPTAEVSLSLSAWGRSG